MNNNCLFLWGPIEQAIDAEEDYTDIQEKKNIEKNPKQKKIMCKWVSSWFDVADLNV